MFLFKEIGENQADLIKSFALFYLLLVGNYIGSSIFTCFQIDYIERNKELQLLISFFLFYFLVTIISDTGKLEFIPPIEKFIHTVFYFIAFLMIMRLDITISAIVIVLVFLLYFIELNKKFYLESGSKIDNTEDQETYEDHKYWITLNYPYKIRWFKVEESDFSFVSKIETVIYYIIMMLLVVGFIAYGGEIHDTLRHSKTLTWIKVITDTKICRIKHRKSFWHYLKIGLGIKI